MSVAQNGEQSPNKSLEGRWRLISGSVGRRTGTARGIVIHLLGNDALEFELQQATVTRLAEDGRPIPNPISVSGHGRGIWRLISEKTTGQSWLIVLEGLCLTQFRIHPRRGPPIPLPIQALQNRISRQLSRIENLPLSIELNAPDLQLVGMSHGMPLMFQFEVEPTRAC